MANDSLKKHHSFSSLDCFDKCKYMYYIKYVLGEDGAEEYLAEGNYYAEVGSFMHEILAKIFEGTLSIDDAPNYFIEHYDESVFYKVKKSIMDKIYDLCLDYLATEDFSWTKGYEVVGVELRTELTIQGYNFLGFIDLLLRNTETSEYWLIDHKSAPYPFRKDGTGVLAKSKKSFESYKRQMYLYCHAVKQLYGEFPQKITWNHFKEKKLATIPFQMEEYEDTIKWFSETIKKIEEEENFEPTKEFFHCTFICDYRNCCEYKKYE